MVSVSPQSILIRRPCSLRKQLTFLGATTTSLYSILMTRLYQDLTVTGLVNQVAIITCTQQGQQALCSYSSHLRGTKLLFWRGKVPLGQDKQKTYIILNGNFPCLSCPRATFLSSMAVLYHVNGQLQRADSNISSQVTPAIYLHRVPIK